PGVTNGQEIGYGCSLMKHRKYAFLTVDGHDQCRAGLDDRSHTLDSSLYTSLEDAQNGAKTNVTG
ncbi:hypothetical protein, partial [Pseudomonas viridiflava]|uniref:hypothetical protein n=1 Tax=Pseudomonas viridiflava TaxID=33069 RepID=UPI00197DBFCF